MKNYSSMPDDELVSLYQQGDNSAFDEIFNRYHEKLLRFISAKTKNKSLSEDIVQTAFLKVINVLQKGKYSKEGKFASWIQRIASNLFFDYTRANKKQRFVSMTNDKSTNNNGWYWDMVLPNDSNNGERSIIDKETQRMISEIIDKLSFEQKEVIILRSQDFKFNEIAEITGVTIGTVMGRVRYARRKINKMLNGKMLQAQAGIKKVKKEYTGIPATLRLLLDQDFSTS